MMTNPLEYWHEYVEDEYHNQHVADVGRRTWQHPPTKLMAPIQRVKPARLLMSPSNTNSKQTEIKEEEKTNKNSFRIQWYRTKSMAFEIWANQNLLIFSEDWCCKHPIICRADQRNLQLVFTNAGPEDKVTLQRTEKIQKISLQRIY